MPKINALPPMTSPDGDDVVAIDDVSTTNKDTKKLTLTALKEWFQSLVGWITTAMIGDDQVTSSKLSAAVRGFDSFSTSEVATAATWIDGKTIYKKTVSFGTLPNNTTKSVAHGITGIDKVIAFEGFAQGSTGVAYALAPMNSAVSGTSLGGAMIETANIVFRTTTDLTATAVTSYFTIYYTKT